MRILGSVVAIALAVASRTSFAQLTDTPLPPARFGFTGGLNLTTFAGNGLGPTADRRGFVGGVDFVTPFTPSFSTQIEALYAMKGMKSLGVNSSGYAMFKLDYIEIPVMLRGDLPLSGSFKPFAFTGPALDIKVHCWSDVVANGTTVLSESCSQSSSGIQKFNNPDVGWVMGGGAGFDFHNRRISFEARYEVGLRPILAGGSSKNRALSFMAAVEAPLPRRRVR